MRLIGYARVSTREQQTIQNQVDKLRVHCDLHEHELVHVYRDEGESGKDVDRRGLKDCMHALRNKNIDGLVITKLDRLSRSVRDWSNLMERFDRMGKRIISMYDSIDTSTASGRMIANMFAMIAQWERETIVERTQAAMDYLRSQDRRLARDPPWGWKIDPTNDKMLIPDPTEAEVVRQVRDWRREKLSYRKIEEKAAERGYLSRSGKRLHRETIRRICIAKKLLPGEEDVH
jgi:site-specific DNA recombinase